MFVIDTNVLVYAANAADPAHARCQKLVEETRAGRLPWALTWGIVYEFLRVVTHPRVLADPWDLPHAWAFILGLLASPRLQMLVETARHHEAMDDLVRNLPSCAGSMLHDAHIAALMREHGIKRIVTRDTGFHRFSFLQVTDPVRD